MEVVRLAEGAVLKTVDVNSVRGFDSLRFRMLCPLCRADKITPWIYEDEVCWIAKCKTCGGDMIVLWHHGEPTLKELDHLKKVSQKIFPDKKWRGYRRMIKDHWHEHFI